jgi:hypothetical protein
MMAKVDSSGMLSLEGPCIGVADCSLEASDLASLQPMLQPENWPPGSITTTQASSSTNSSPLSGWGSDPNSSKSDPSSPGNADSCNWLPTSATQPTSVQTAMKSISGSHLKDLLMGGSCVYQSTKKDVVTTAAANNSHLLQLLKSGPAYANPIAPSNFGLQVSQFTLII